MSHLIAEGRLSVSTITTEAWRVTVMRHLARLGVHPMQDSDVIEITFAQLAEVAAAAEGEWRGHRCCMGRVES